MSRELLRMSAAALSVLLAAVGCATDTADRPEPETPRLTIEDQSTDAPPPPPPSAPPPDAESINAPPVNAPAPPTPPSAPLARPAPQSAPNTDPAPPNASAPSAPPPSAPPPSSSAQWAYEYPSGRWVYANGYGWIWVPANAASEDSDGVPYSYLYTPSSGWNWYISPWGVGAYHYGGWVHRPYRPAGYHGGWVAHPRVVVRLGGRGHGYYNRRHRRW